MMDKASAPNQDSHYEVEVLLPWYVTGQLDPAEIAIVDGHLAGCARCRAQLSEERELREAVAGLPFATQAVEPSRPLPRPAARPAWTRLRQTPLRPRTAAWFLSGQAVMLLALFAILQPSMHPSPEYRTLSAAPRAGIGNAVIVFQPTATEADLRHALKLVGATIVDGPNAAGAYTIRLGSGERAAQLKSLRSQKSVVLAEAIDGEAKP